MKGVFRAALVAALPLLAGAAPTIPWGWAEGLSGRTELTDYTVPPDATNVVFIAGEIFFDGIVLADRVLSFTANPGGTTIVVGGACSGFELSGASGNWTFRGVAFRGLGERKDTLYDGGAICCNGGRLTLDGCSFSDLNSRFTGGAVSAYLMDGDVTVSNCTFNRNVTGPMNGMGGALYASRNGGAAGVLRLTGCTFSNNSAQNGGAVSTVRVVDDGEGPMPIEIDGGSFSGNSADYAGGAIDDEGKFRVENALFADNVAALQGGAICAGTSDPEWLGAEVSILAGTVFRGNSASNSVNDDRWWTAGGAVSLANEGYSLSVDGSHVIFESNRADAPAGAYGGAIYTAEGTSVEVVLAEFCNNVAKSAGGAIFANGNGLSVSTSIFHGDTATDFGGAVAVNGAQFCMLNSTVRKSGDRAVDIFGSATPTMSNCVIADNGGRDIHVEGIEGSSVLLSLDHCAYGVAFAGSSSSLSAESCIRGCGASIFAGDTLRLNGDDGYNAVAAEGLVQTATDYDGVVYGSIPEGYSMGAYECGTSTPPPPPPPPPPPDDSPKLSVEDAVWYHNRSDGLYYPRITVTLLEGNPARIGGVTFECEGVTHELPSAELAKLQTMSVGESITLGVNPATFVQYPDSPDNTGFVPPADRLFSSYSATRPSELKVAVVTKVKVLPYREAAVVYDGYLMGGNGIAGTIKVNVAKGKVDKKTGVLTAKLSASVTMMDGSKVSFSGGVADGEGNVLKTTKKNHTLNVALSEKGLVGNLNGKYAIGGMRNVFTGKIKGDKAIADAAIAKWGGSFTVDSGDGQIKVKVSKKGKVTISGKIGGVKLSKSGQLLVGEGACIVPVIGTKKNPVSFALCLPDEGAAYVCR